MRYKPSKTEVFAKKSSLAFDLYEDDFYHFRFNIYDRRTNRIVYDGNIPVVTLGSFMDLSKIEKRKK